MQIFESSKIQKMMNLVKFEAFETNFILLFRSLFVYDTE